MDYVALTENRVLQNPAVDLYIYICYICSDSVFRQTHSRDFWFKKVIRGLAV